MIRLQDGDWFQQSVWKLEVALDFIHSLDGRTDYSVHDQIFINVILGLIRSPIDYAINEIHDRKKAIRNKAYFPFYPSGKINQDEKYKKIVMEYLGRNDDELIKILKSIQPINGETWFKDLNHMNNNEKHSSIAAHKKLIHENTGHFKFGDNLISNNTIIYEDTPENTHRDVSFFNIGGMNFDITKNKGYKKEIKLIFESNEEYVFDFLIKCVIHTNEFIIDVFEYLNKRQPEPLINK